MHSQIQERIHSGLHAEQRQQVSLKPQQAHNQKIYENSSQEMSKLQILAIFYSGYVYLCVTPLILRREGRIISPPESAVESARNFIF